MKLGAAMMTKKLKRGSSRMGEMQLREQALSENDMDPESADTVMRYREWAAKTATRPGSILYQPIEKMPDSGLKPMKKIGPLKRKP